MIRRPPRSTLDHSSAASDVYKRQAINFYETLYFFGDSAGGEDFYGLQILKMDPNGILLWAETIEHAWITENGLVVNGSGDIFITARMDQQVITCLLYTSPSPRDRTRSRMPSSA